MYIVFDLPHGAGGIAPSMARHEINKELQAWSAQWQLPYKTKTVKYTHRLILESNQDCEFFMLTWHPKTTKSWLKCRVVLTNSD